jgi:hypothetical protein
MDLSNALWVRPAIRVLPGGPYDVNEVRLLRFAETDMFNTASIRPGGPAIRLPRWLPQDGMTGDPGIAGHLSRYDLTDFLERTAGIEPASIAWEATALPLSYTRLAKVASMAQSGPQRQDWPHAVVMGFALRRAG